MSPASSTAAPATAGTESAVGDIWERLTWSYPDKDAIVAREGAFAYAENQRLSFRQADELANRVANAVLARGLERGDRVLFYCENSVEAYVTKIGLAKAGVVAAPINPMLAPDVVTHLIEQVEPKLAFVDDELWPKAEPRLRRGRARADGDDPDRRRDGAGQRRLRRLRRRRLRRPSPRSRSTATTSGRSSSPRGRRRCRRGRWSPTTTPTSAPTPSP